MKEVGVRKNGANLSAVVLIELINPEVFDRTMT